MSWMTDKLQYEANSGVKEQVGSYDGITASVCFVLPVAPVPEVHLSKQKAARSNINTGRDNYSR